MDKDLRSAVLGLPRPAKRIIVMAVDGALAVIAVWLAYYLRVGQFLPLMEITNGWYLLPASIVAVAVSIPIFMLFGLYQVDRESTRGHTGVVRARAVQSSN